MTLEGEGQVDTMMKNSPTSTNAGRRWFISQGKGQMEIMKKNFLTSTCGGEEVAHLLKVKVTWRS